MYVFLSVQITYFKIYCKYWMTTLSHFQVLHYSGPKEQSPPEIKKSPIEKIKFWEKVWKGLQIRAQFFFLVHLCNCLRFLMEWGLVTTRLPFSPSVRCHLQIISYELTNQSLDHQPILFSSGNKTVSHSLTQNYNLDILSSEEHCISSTQFLTYKI